MTIVNLLPNDSTIILFNVGSMHSIRPEVYRIEVRRPQEWIKLPVSIVHKDPRVIRRLFDSIEEEVVASTPALGPSIAKPVVHFLDQTRIEILPGGAKESLYALTLERVLR